MVCRKLTVHHNDAVFHIDYDSDDDFEVFKFQLFSLTSIPPDQQKIYKGDGDQLVLDESDLVSLCDRLRLVSVTDDVKESVEQNAEVAMSDEELARMLQAEEEALMLQQFAAGEQNSEVEARLRPYMKQVLMYEDSIRQDAARRTVPVEKLEEKALVALAKEGNFEPTKIEQDHAFLLQLLFWFKTSFSWVNAPSCDGCGGETTNNGMGTPIPSESLYGGSRVELYRCNNCSRITRFPRYNDPAKLLETRKGRCGEWANCFTLYCRSFGYESRLILDFTDHVWTECFSPLLGRWMHLDPCEGIYDNPLLYEKGWKKKLDYVIAIANDGVYDVTKRYTRNWHEVLSRRRIATEPVLSTLLSGMRRECREKITYQVVSELEERDRNETEALDRDVYSKEDASISLPGRISGNKEWRILRSEFGSDEDSSLSSSSCPVRICVDEHVTKIYNAFSPVISQFVESSFSKSRAIEILQIFRRILVELKNSPFRMRRTSLSANPTHALKDFLNILPSFGKLLDALSLKSQLVNNEKTEFCLAGNPVLTSLALPVVFHALDDVVHHVNIYENMDKNSLYWPLLKLNRLCLGQVLASGEELPFGIATAAFDGTRMTKWEEPNGARGCWIMYKVPDNQVHQLVGYELMSANDAPERDPKDWVLEGSSNGGSTWRLIDTQNSQNFEKRFQRKTFSIKSESFPANSFRFRFLAVLDEKATPRFQIGSIDLYARS